MTSNPTQTGEGIDTLTEKGAVPQDRMASALQAQAVVNRLIQNDAVRSQKRAKVRGLVDGNPPYKASALKAAGRSDACNVNWRMAESYVNAAITLFYDLFSESQTYATIQLDGDNDVVKKSRIATEEFDRLQREEKSFDYNVQLSIYDMVLYGMGPFIFEDALDWRCRAFQMKDLKVPDNAVSDANQWELAVLLVDYQPDQLYKFIRDEEAAGNVGWNVEATKQAIINAYPKQDEGNNEVGWEWYQEQLKTGSFHYSMVSKVIPVAHIYYREFPVEGETEGRISHKIVLRQTSESTNETGGETQKNEEFLFSKVRRYKNWSEVVHPMYYDHGNGGKHYAVTGMGVKMYSAMEYQNRLLCKLADDAFAPKVMFKPTTATASQQMNLLQFGQYAVMPTGFDLVQTAINPLIQDGLLLNNEISKTVSANLSSYRQNLQDKPGNPITASEANIKASEQAKLGKTQLNRYYAQLDALFAEKFRRATNPNLINNVPGGREALAFQERCAKRGVTKSDLAKVRSVQATRVVGQGSAYLRQQALEFLLGLVAMLPEDGRANLIQDVIAARSGQFSVERYYPSSVESKKPNDQNAEAMQWVAAMKVGVMPVVTSTQNAVIYAQTFLQAAGQAAQSIQQGANPVEAIKFIDISGQAIVAQLERIKADPTRKAVYETLLAQWQELAQVADQIKAQLEAAQNQQAGQREAMQQADSEIQMKQAKASHDMQMKEQKNRQAMRIKDESAAQKLALADAMTAARISNQRTPQKV